MTTWRMRGFTTGILVTIAAAAFALASACGDPEVTPTPLPTVTPQPTATPQPAATPAPTATPQPMPTPRPNPTPRPVPISPLAIYEIVTPSLVRVETPVTRGTGVLIEGGYIIANAHVLLPYSTARVTFRDGDVIEDAPVVHVDYLSNTAVLGPVQTSAPPVSLAEDYSPRVGAAVYLLAHQWHDGAGEAPAMTEGIISGLAEWSPAELTLIQTDAGRTVGHHGGALVSADGTVVGISGLVDLHSHIPLVPTVGSLMPRLLALLDSGSVSDAGDRLVREDDFECEP